MTTYYVATLAHYVLVEADTEEEAQDRARPLLEELRAGVARAGADRLPIRIRTVRPATADEIALLRFDARMREGE
jgi:hypothetical protein